MRCDACGIGTSADGKGTGDIWWPHQAYYELFALDKVESTDRRFHRPHEGTPDFSIFLIL